MCTSSFLPLSFSFLFLSNLCSFIHSFIGAQIFTFYFFPAYDLSTFRISFQFFYNYSRWCGWPGKPWQPGVNILVIHWSHPIPPHSAKKQTKSPVKLRLPVFWNNLDETLAPQLLTPHHSFFDFYFCAPATYFLRSKTS